MARDQKAGGVVPTGTDAFFPAEVPSAPVHPDTVTHGHGDTVAGHVASVYACLVVAEAMAIRWHMGFSGTEDPRTVGQALQQYPLAFALATADMEASYFLAGER